MTIRKFALRLVALLLLVSFLPACNNDQHIIDKHHQALEFEEE